MPRGIIGDAMTARPLPHPDPEDLARVAQEQLGRTRTEWVFEHCRVCQPCADQLLALVSDRARSEERPLLTVWNWVSLAVLVAIVLGALGFFSWASWNAVAPSSGF
jgi:hypothetical protein